LEWGIVDVSAWLRTLPRGTLDKWIEFDSIEPIGEQRLQTAEITAILHRLTAYTLGSHGIDMAPLNIDGYMPPRYVPEVAIVQPAKKTKPEDEFQQMASVLRLGKVVEKHGRISKPS
jgi:hypothetical protein